MINKNINTGSLNTEGGDVRIGDNLNYYINGLSELLQEYKAQLENIEFLINSFKLRTALRFLEELEGRFNEGEVENVKISSKILFLKASCKRELKDFSVQNTAKEFIQAYNLNPNDEKIKTRACIEYLNVNEDDKSLAIANDILKKDEFDQNAWLVKVFCSKDLKKILTEIPKSVFDSYNFQHSLIYHLIRNVELDYIEDLKEYGLKLNIEIEKYKTLTYENKQAWIIAIDLLINKIFNDYPVRYISGDSFVLEDNPLVEEGIVLLERFVNALGDSEIKESIVHQSFFFNYFKYFRSKDEKFLTALEVDYYQLPSRTWFYVLTYCQALNYDKGYEKSLKSIKEYEENGGVKISELYLFKATVMFLTKKEGEIHSVFEEYLGTIKLIDERVVFNVFNAFINVLHRSALKEDFEVYISKVLDKDFRNNELKILFEITSKVRYFEEIDEEDIYSKIQIIKEKSDFNDNCKNLIAENLDNLRKTEEAINFLNTYLDKSIVSPTLRFYIILLDKQLYTNKESGRGIYKELLNLLQFYRLNSKYTDEHLLGLEHNLNLEKNDWAELKNIDFALYKGFPNEEKYLFFYLICLEKLGLLEGIDKLSNDISEDFTSENIGVQVSKLLLRNNINKAKGSKIMFGLASNPSNTQARKFYMGISHLFVEDFFKKYNEVEKNVWVKYSINNEKVDEVKIVKQDGLQGDLLGKKIGDKITKENKITGIVNIIQILQIYNDELRLHYEIQKEAQNPVNELGFSSFEIPKKIEDFEKFLVEQFGAFGTQEKIHNDNSLKDYYNYRIGFSEVTRSVFRDNPINAYLNLINGKEHKFTTLPSLATKPMLENGSITYALDFTSLLLFFFLERDMDFKFENKFHISYLLKEWVSGLLTEERHSRDSPMSVQITTNGIKKFLNPEDYKENRITFFESILKWIDDNCNLDLVEEKLDIVLKFKDSDEAFDLSMKLLIDNMYLSMRNNYRLISSDSTLFIIQNRAGKSHNMLNPEKYLVSCFSERNNTELYRYFLKSNYLGININLDTLKNEFYAMLVGNENYYQMCLDNLQYSINNNPNVINLVAKFLKEVYLISSILLANKNRYAFDIFISTFYGMPKQLIMGYERLLKKEFILLGDNYDEVLKIFKEVKSLFKYS